jgi:hypothetical protein
VVNTGRGLQDENHKGEEVLKVQKLTRKMMAWSRTPGEVGW